MSSTRLAHIILHTAVALTLFCEQYKFRSPSLYSVLTLLSMYRSSVPFPLNTVPKNALSTVKQFVDRTYNMCIIWPDTGVIPDTED